ATRTDPAVDWNGIADRLVWHVEGSSCGMTFAQDGPGRDGEVVTAEGSGNAHRACGRGSRLGELDPSLRAFMEAEGEADAEARLAALLEEQATPIVRAIAARKLRAYGGPGKGFPREDLEDVTADALLALVS